MPRFIQIKGKRGVLVESPHAPEIVGRGHGGSRAHHYLGQRPIVDAPKGTPYPLCFEPAVQVVQDDTYHHIRKACADGDLEMIGECIAETIELAIAKLAMPDAPKAKTDKGRKAE